MNRYRFRSSNWAVASVSALSLAGLEAQAQDDFDDPTLDRNRVQVNARFAFNITAEFRNTALPLNTRPNYDDGFVLPDIGGSADGTTWYWGYTDASQAQGGNLDLHLVGGSPRDGTAEETDAGLQAGFEVLYGRVLGFIDLKGDRKIAWGVQGGFGSLDVNIEEDNTIGGDVVRSGDRYRLGNVTPPVAPYAGTFEGPGPLLSTQYTALPNETVAATSYQNAQLDSLVLGLKLGPFIEVPLSERFSVEVSAGVAAMDVLTTFRYTESLALTGVSGAPPLPYEGDYDDSEWVLGFYGNVTVSYAVNYNLRLFLGAQFTGLDDVTVTGGTKEATLKLGQQFEILAGIRASF